MAKGRSIVNLQTNLRSLKYVDFAPGSAPYVSKDIGEDIQSSVDLAENLKKQSQFSKEIQGVLKSAKGESTTRVDDLVRISKFIASGKGILWESKQIGLQALQTSLDQQKFPEEGFWKNLLTGVGNSLLGALKTTTGLLTQVVLGQEGYHHETYQTRAYLNTGGDSSVFNTIISSAGLWNSSKKVSGANLAKQGKAISGAPGYSLLGDAAVNSAAVGNNWYAWQGSDNKLSEELSRRFPGEIGSILKAVGTYSPEGVGWDTIGGGNLVPQSARLGRRYSSLQGETYLEGGVVRKPALDVEEVDGKVQVSYFSATSPELVEHGILSQSLDTSVVGAKQKTSFSSSVVAQNEFTESTGKSWENKNRYSSGSETGQETTYLKYISKASGSSQYEYAVERKSQNLPGSVEKILLGTKQVSEHSDRHGNQITHYSLQQPDYDVDEYQDIRTASKVENPSEGDGLYDFINQVPFYFSLISPEKRRYVHFKANLEKLSDEYKGNWEETQYVGRADRFYTYSGFGREISFSFKVVATSQDNLRPLYRTLQSFVAATAPTYGEGNMFMRGTIGTVQIGDYLVNQYGMFKSIGLGWTTDYPWEIDGRQLRVPHVLDVNVQFTPIHNFIPTSMVDFSKKYTYFGGSKLED